MDYAWDWNEWYTVLLSLIAMSIFMAVRKHFRLSVILLIWVYNVTFVATVDYALVDTPFDVYYCGDNETYEPISAFAHIFLYSPFSFIFLYFYDRWQVRGMKLVLFLAGWTCFSLFFEWLNIRTGFLVYKHWKLYYSIPTYPVSGYILIKVYRFITRNLPDRAQDHKP